MKAPRLTVIEGGGEGPLAADPPKSWECKECATRLGVATSTILAIISSPKIQAGRVIDGMREYVCAYCWSERIYTPAGLAPLAPDADLDEFPDDQ